MPEDQNETDPIELSGYEPPPLSLLDVPERKTIEIDEETLKKNSLLIEKIMKEYDVDGRVVAIHPGPVITMYEFEPAAGTKVSKIVGMEDDLSLMLGGYSVFIVPRLLGKTAVGIEITNGEREIVWLRDVISSQFFHGANYSLPLALGRSTSGHPAVANLAEMPHILITGAAGSGKSVTIDSYILSLLYVLSPAEVRFILIDSKMVDFSVYDGIPHLLLPAVTKPKEAVLAMRWAIRELERRRSIMADIRTRNILGYNEKIMSGQVEMVTPERAMELLESDHEAVIHTGTIPYIVIVINDIAELTSSAGTDLDECITRLALHGKAAGIHLIISTGQPSIKAIKELLNNNLLARVTLKGNYQNDAQLLTGIEDVKKLSGEGDMYFTHPYTKTKVLIHGAYVTVEDVSRVVAHLNAQGRPVYDESIIEEPANDGSAFDMNEDENALYDQAVMLVAETKQASISMVQRRLRIGYGLAARMIERMEAEGVVGAADGSKPRRVLVGNGNE